VFAIQHAFVLFAPNNIYLNEIWWSLTYPCTLLISVSYLSSLVELLPNITYLERGNIFRYLKVTERVRHIFFAVFATVTTAISFILFCVYASDEVNAYTPSGDSVFRGVMVYLVISFLLFWVAFTYCGILFIQSASSSLAQNAQAQANKANHGEIEILVVTIRKTKQNIIGLTWNIFVVVVFFCCLAFYDDFMINLPFAQVIAGFVINGVPGLGLPMTILLYVADIKIALAKRAMRTKGTSDADSSVVRKHSSVAPEHNTPAMAWFMSNEQDPEGTMNDFLEMTKSGM